MRMSVPGVSVEVNRYYVISTWLRESGWEGAGDRWWDGRDWHDFEDAAFIMNLHRRYKRESLKELRIDIGDGVAKWFRELCERVNLVLDGIGDIAADDEQYTEYEWAWIEWAEVRKA